MNVLGNDSTSRRPEGRAPSKVRGEHPHSTGLGGLYKVSMGTKARCSYKTREPGMEKNTICNRLYGSPTCNTIDYPWRIQAEWYSWMNAQSSSRSLRTIGRTEDSQSSRAATTVLQCAPNMLEKCGYLVTSGLSNFIVFISARRPLCILYSCRFTWMTY